MLHFPKCTQMIFDMYLDGASCHEFNTHAMLVSYLLNADKHNKPILFIHLYSDEIDYFIIHFPGGTLAVEEAVLRRYKYKHAREARLEYHKHHSSPG